MKTQKQLPNEFTFVCDKNSREQLEKLGVDFNNYTILCYKHYYTVVNKYVINYSRDKPNNYKPINLSDYIDQEQPEPKWQYRTRGGFKILDIKETINEHWVVSVNPYGDIELYLCLPSGINTGGNPYYDLLPIENTLLATLEKELEELRVKEKELLEKIEELKK